MVIKASPASSRLRGRKTVWPGLGEESVTAVGDGSRLQGIATCSWSRSDPVNYLTARWAVGNSVSSGEDGTPRSGGSARDHLHTARHSFATPIRQLAHTEISTPFGRITST